MNPDIFNADYINQVKPKIIDTALGTIEYIEFGEGPVVISIHGAMGGYDQGLILAQTVGSAGYRYIAISRPGYLGTPLTSGESAYEQGNLIAAFLDSMNITKVGILAISGGGAAAIEFALVHPHRCNGLVLIAVNAKKVKKSLPLRFVIMTIFSRIPWVADYIRKRVEVNIKRVARRSIKNNHIYEKTINNKVVWPLFKALVINTYKEISHCLTGTVNDVSIAKTTSYPLEDMEVPILNIHGTEDRVVPYHIHATELKRRISQLEMMTIEGGEHVAIFTHREVIKLRVAEFMEMHFRE